MKHHLLAIVLAAVALAIIGPGVCAAGDLDDGISKFTDDSIEKYDELGEKDPNISYIMMKAASQASKGNEVDDGSKSANMNSAVIGPGARINGPIIIIDKSKGDKTQVVK